MSYSGDPSASAKDLVRFMLSDTTAPFDFTDAELVTMLALQGGDMARTLDTLCTSMEAKAARRPYDERVEGLAVTWGDVASKYRALRSSFKAMAANGTLPTHDGVITEATPIGPQLLVDTESVWAHL